MGKWIEPKTNWTENDRFEFEDYNRIKNNIYYLWEKGCNVFPYFSIKNMGGDMSSEEEDFNVNYFNSFEENIDILNQNTFAQNLGMKQTFYINGVFIKWDELNRIEGACLKIKKNIEAKEKSSHKLPFWLGGPRDLRI